MDENERHVHGSPAGALPDGQRSPSAAGLDDSTIRNLLEVAPDGFIVADANGLILLVNAQVEKLFGYERTELLGQPIEMLVPARYRASHPAKRLDYLRNARPRPMGAGLDLYGLRKDGSEFPAEISLAPLQGPHSTLAMATVRDVTVQRRAEHKFRGVLEAAPDAIVIVDPSGRIVLVNAQTEKLFGYSRDALIGKPVEMLMPSKYRERHAGHRSRFFSAAGARAMGADLALYALRSDGTEFPVEISLSPLETEDGVLVSSAIRDISERKKAEEQFRDLLESAPDSMVIVDHSGVIVLVNAQTERLFGYARSELMGNPVEMLIPARFGRLHAQHRTGYFVAPRPRSMGSGLELFGRRKDGTEFPVEISLSPMQTPNGVLVSAAVRDTTERKLIEARIQEASRLKSEFLANMSHELRTPLNAIIGFAELMHSGRVGPLASQHTEFLGDILTSSRHLLRLINDVLDLAKVESGKMEFHAEELDIARLVQEVRDIVRGLAATKRIRLEMRIDPGLSRVFVDPARVKQILYNYLSNGIKFTPEGGTVTVRAAAEGDEQFRLEVEDTGIGIAPESIEKLFVEFQQLDATPGKKYQGTGLGLALTKRIAEAHGGRVEVKSRVGQGSVFSVVLPRTSKGEGA